MTDIPIPPKRRTGLLIWLIVSQLLAVGSLIIWGVMTAFSVMAFDSGDTPEARRFVLLFLVYPLFPLLMAISAWVAFGFRKNRLAGILSGVTFMPPVLFLFILWIVTMIGV